jgi:hypothetical protein
MRPGAFKPTSERALRSGSCAVAAVIHVAFKIAGIGTETSMSRSLAKLVFLAACLVAMGGWIWLLGIGIKWLVVKI